jgi:hypothetical protein
MMAFFQNCKLSISKSPITRGKEIVKYFTIFLHKNGKKGLAVFFSHQSPLIFLLRNQNKKEKHHFLVVGIFDITFYAKYTKSVKIFFCEKGKCGARKFCNGGPRVR